jgi:hypothetical protein
MRDKIATLIGDGDIHGLTYFSRFLFRGRDHAPCIGESYHSKSSPAEKIEPNGSERSMQQYLQ